MCIRPSAVVSLIGESPDYAPGKHSKGVGRAPDTHLAPRTNRDVEYTTSVCRQREGSLKGSEYALRSRVYQASSVGRGYCSGFSAGFLLLLERVRQRADAGLRSPRAQSGAPHLRPIRSGGWAYSPAAPKRLADPVTSNCLKPHRSPSPESLERVPSGGVRLDNLRLAAQVVEQHVLAQPTR